MKFEKHQSIGQVAKRVGVSTETLRRWEAEGLIPPARREFINHWRVWTDEEIEMIEGFMKQRSVAILTRHQKL